MACSMNWYKSAALSHEAVRSAREWGSQFRQLGMNGWERKGQFEGQDIAWIRDAEGHATTET